MRYPGIGAAGQERIGAAIVTVVGCGALGSASVNLLARGGVGEIRIIDRDVVELTNLQRQVLFEERDAEAGVPKAVAAAAAVARINSTVRALPVVADLTPVNVLELLAGSSVVIDGTDNLETRLPPQRRVHADGTPVGLRRRGRVDRHGDGHRPRAHRLLPLPLSARCRSVTRLETCETAGILAAGVVTVAAFQWTQAVKLLVGGESDTAGRLLTVDVWSGDYQVVHEIPRQAACPCCVDGVYEYLDARTGSAADPAEARSPDERTGGA